jgi:hypothetical protein
MRQSVVPSPFRGRPGGGKTLTAEYSLYTQKGREEVNVKIVTSENI